MPRSAGWSLHQVDPEPAQQGERRAVLDVFRHHGLAKAERDADHGLHKHLVIGIVGQVADENSVDLDGVDLQMLEIGEGGEADAEVVEVDAATELVQRFDHALGVVQVGHRSRFSDFDNQAAWVDAGLP